MARRMLRIVTASVTGLVVVAALAALCVAGAVGPVDGAGASGAGAGHEVSQSRLESYCDRSMPLADDADYGDSEFQASAGDLSYAARYAALGSVYDASARPLDASADAADAAGAIALNRADGEDGGAFVVSSADGARGHILLTDLLKAGEGTGQVGATVSKAKEGDLRGISAATCVVPALTARFLVTGTQTGATQRLVVTNPSPKATAVDITLRGTSQAGALAMSTGGTLTVGPSSQATLDLSAAASGEDALYVTVASGQTPVAVVVRSVTMDGLTPHGSEVAVPLADSASTLALPGVRQGDRVRLLAYARDGAHATVSWVTGDGLVDAGDHDLPADQVASLDLGDAPDGAMAVLVTADSKVTVGAVATRDGADGQQDYALVPAATPAGSGAVALPDGVRATLTLANTTDANTSVTVTTYGADGREDEAKQVELGADGAEGMDVTGSVVVVEDPDDAVAWSVRLTDGGLDKAKVAGLSVLGPTPLDVRQTTVWATQSQQVVR